MRIRQHCSFGFTSTSVTADDMTARLGLEPDRILVRGSRRAEPPRPVFHIWEVRCDESSLRVDDQVERLVDRLEPYADAIGALAEELERDGGGSYLSVVRHFDDEHGEEEELSPPEEPLQKARRPAPVARMAPRPAGPGLPRGDPRGNRCGRVRLSPAPWSAPESGPPRIEVATRSQGSVRPRGCLVRLGGG